MKKLDGILLLFILLVIIKIGYSRDYTPKPEVIIEIKDIDEPYEEDDFLRIRKERYANGSKNVREFLYFSRWHKYLEEVEDEEFRRKEYEDSLRQYENEVKKINIENQKEREKNGVNYAPQGEALDITNIK